MFRFKNLLFVAQRVPGDLAALDRAVALAFDSGARLRLGISVDLLPPGWGADRWANTLNGVLRDERRRLMPLLLPLKSRNLLPEIEVWPGNALVETVQAVARERQDLVILADDPAISRTRLLNLHRFCPCPVWAIRVSSADRYRHVLVAVDAMRNESGIVALHDRLLHFADRVCREDDARLSVLHAWQLPDAAGYRSGFDLAAWNALQGELREVNRAALQRAMGTISGEPLLLQGAPSTLIPRVIKDQGVDLLMMGTVNTLNEPGFYIGHTAEHVLQHAHASVFAAKPDGYFSPIETTTTNRKEPSDESLQEHPVRHGV